MLHLHISALCVVLCGPCLLWLVFVRIISGWQCLATVSVPVLLATQCTGCTLHRGAAALYADTIMGHSVAPVQSEVVTINSAFSSQYWIRWPLNSYFLIVCKKYRTVPLLSSPVRCPPVSQSTAHIYANPPFSNFHHQLGVLLVAGWAGLVWLVPLIINLEIKTKARLAAAAVSGPTPAPAPTLGEYTI